jgi:hypothetical protein
MPAASPRRRQLHDSDFYKPVFSFLIARIPAAQLLKVSHALLRVKTAHTPCLPAFSAGWLAGFDLDISR